MYELFESLKNLIRSWKSPGILFLHESMNPVIGMINDLMMTIKIFSDGIMQSTGASDHVIEKVIRIYLSGASDRHGGRKARMAATMVRGAPPAVQPLAE